jgi:hypothetical protein
MVPAISSLATRGSFESTNAIWPFEVILKVTDSWCVSQWASEKLVRPEAIRALGSG